MNTATVGSFVQSTQPGLVQLISFPIAKLGEIPAQATQTCCNEKGWGRCERDSRISECSPRIQPPTKPCTVMANIVSRTHPVYVPPRELFPAIGAAAHMSPQTIVRMVIEREQWFSLTQFQKLVEENKIPYEWTAYAFVLAGTREEPVMLCEIARRLAGWSIRYYTIAEALALGALEIFTLEPVSTCFLTRAPLPTKRIN